MFQVISKNIENKSKELINGENEEKNIIQISPIIYPVQNKKELIDEENEEQSIKR
jgi:hypothetical protein